MGGIEKLMTFERKILRRIYGPIENGEYTKIRTNKEIYQMPNINAFMGVKRLECEGHVWRSNGILKKVNTETINGKILR